MEQREYKLDEQAEEAFEAYETMDAELEKNHFGGMQMFVPVQPDRRELIEEKVGLINSILLPQMKSMEHTKTKEEMFGKLERKWLPWVETFNKCLYTARTEEDSNFCSDNLIKKLDTEGVAFAKKLAKEY